MSQKHISYVIFMVVEKVFIQPPEKKILNNTWPTDKTFFYYFFSFFISALTKQDKLDMDDTTLHGIFGCQIEKIKIKKYTFIFLYINKSKATRWDVSC